MLLYPLNLERYNEHEGPVSVIFRNKESILWFKCLCYRLNPTDVYPALQHFLILLIAVNDIAEIWAICLLGYSVPDQGVNVTE